MPRMYGDPFTIPTPDPTRHYRWISDNPLKLSDWLRSYGDVPGYTLEPASNCNRLGLPTTYVQGATGRIVYGHNILASIPAEEHERRTLESVAETTDRLSGAKEEFHAIGDRLPGIRTFEEHPEQTMDRKAFHEREDRPFSGQAGPGKSPVFKPKTA